MKDCKYLIVGGGVTGLSFANFAKDDDWLLCEALDDVGGYCKSIHQDGFTWDYSGHFFHFNTDFVKDLFLSKMKDVDICDVEKITGIIFKNKRIDYPFQKNIHQLDKDDLLDCLYGLFKRQSNSSDSFLNMLYSKFGKGITEKFLKPYNEKVYVCDLDDLDADAMGRFFPHADLDEIISNFKETKKDDSYNNTFIYPRNGSYEFIKAQLKGINNERIYLNHRLDNIDYKNKIAYFTNGKEIKYQYLISSIPFNWLLDTARIEYDKKIYTASKVLVFNLGFDKPSIFNDNWLYFPEKDIIFYRVGFYDNIFKDDKMSLYVEIGLKQEVKIDEEKMLEKVMVDLKRNGIVTNHKLLSYKSIVMDPAYVHIKKESNEDFNKKNQILNSFGIYTIGRYGGWKYCSIEDNIIESNMIYKKLTSGE